LRGRRSDNIIAPPDKFGVKRREFFVKRFCCLFCQEAGTEAKGRAIDWRGDEEMERKGKLGKGDRDFQPKGRRRENDDEYQLGGVFGAQGKKSADP
jgi:hypothetical protein